MMLNIVGEMSTQFFCPFLNQFLSFLDVELLSCLYMLDINSLSIIICNYLFHPVGCLFILLMISFDVQKLLSLIRSFKEFVLLLFPLL